MTSAPPSNQRSSDELFTVAQVATFFQVTEHTVRNWIHGRTVQDKLPAHKVGGSWRVWKSDVVSYGQEKYGL